MTNYLTSNPIFVLSKNDKHSTNAFLEAHLPLPSRIEQEIFDLHSKIEETKKYIRKQKNYFIPPEFNKHWGKCLKLKTESKSAIITILNELKLKNIEYTKHLIFMLGRYRSMCSVLIEITKDIWPIVEKLNGWEKKTEKTEEVAKKVETKAETEVTNIPEQ